MSRVAFFVDVEHGHILATYGLAERAQRFGHLVWYLAPPDSVELIRREGFEVVEVLTEALPRGTVQSLSQRVDGDPQRMLELASEQVLPALASGRGLGPALAHIHPDLLIASSLFRLEALAVRLRHRLPMALVTSQLCLHARAEACRIDLSRLFDMSSGTRELMELIQTTMPGVHAMDDLAAPVLALPELDVTPSPLDLPDRTPDPLVHRLGACLRDDVGARMDWDGIDPSRPLIYCSLGSQAQQRWPVRKRFFEMVLTAASCRPSYQVLLIVGPQASLTFDRPVPPNVTLRRWVPQLEVLGRTSLMITHGGVGTIKEAVLHAVPMVACPVGRDQFLGAKAVEHHGLGFVGDLESMTAPELVALLDRGLEDRELRARLRRMRDAVEREEAACAAVDYVSGLLGAHRSSAATAPELTGPR